MDWDTSGSTAATADEEVSSAPLLLQEIRSSTCDYVADTKWSPTHSALFACAHAGGTVALGISPEEHLSLWEPFVLGRSKSTNWNNLNALGGHPMVAASFVAIVLVICTSCRYKKEAAPLEDDERRAEANVLAWREARSRRRISVDNEDEL